MSAQAVAMWALGVLQVVVILLISWNLNETIALGKADAAADVVNTTQDNRIEALETWRFTIPVRR